MANPNTKKTCVVPKCSSSTTNTPEKLFFYVPMDKKSRKKWLEAMRRLDPIGDRSTVYCCEDHFDVENDMESYIKFKLVGGRIKLKKGTLPHKFQCQQDKNNPDRSAAHNPDHIKYYKHISKRSKGVQTNLKNKVHKSTMTEEKYFKKLVKIISKPNSTSVSTMTDTCCNASCEMY